MTSPSEKIGTINVTPLIDVLLVLLIIFMVIVPHNSHGLQAELPQNAVAAANRQPEPEIVLEITRDRQFLLNGQAVARTELTREVSKLYRNRADRQLFIRADKDIEFQEVALAMDDTRGVDSSVQFGLLAGK